jgi:hypothetical protein
VAFHPYITVATMIPMTIDPAGVGVGWFHIVSGDPDVCVVVPAVIAGVPGPVGVFVRWWRHDFDRTRWWRADADYDLGLGNACGEKECAGESGEEFFHRAISL